MNEAIPLWRALSQAFIELRRLKDSHSQTTQFAFDAVKNGVGVIDTKAGFANIADVRGAL